MSDGIDLKRAGPGDVDFIHDLQRLDHVRDFVGAQDKPEIRDTLERADECYLLGTNDDGDRVAFAQLRGLHNENSSIELFKLAVAVPKRGYGRAFLSRLQSHVFRDLRANRLWLDVYPDNTTARRLYRKMGFIEEGIMRDAYKSADGFRSVVLMSILACEFAKERPPGPGGSTEGFRQQKPAG